MEQDMEKALQALAKAIKGNEAVDRVEVKIVLKKQKPSKASEERK